MKNLKDLVTTICGVISLVSGVILSLPESNIFTPTVKTIAGGLAALSVALIGYMSGKNPDGSTKTIDPNTGQQEIKQ